MIKLQYGVINEEPVTCTLCGQPADILLVYPLLGHRVEVLLCRVHLEMLREDRLEDDFLRGRIWVEPITSDSVIPGPRTTRIPTKIPPSPVGGST